MDFGEETRSHCWLEWEFLLPPRPVRIPVRLGRVWVCHGCSSVLWRWMWSGMTSLLSGQYWKSWLSTRPPLTHPIGGWRLFLVQGEWKSRVPVDAQIPLSVTLWGRNSWLESRKKYISLSQNHFLILYALIPIIYVIKSKVQERPGMVAHTYKPSTLGGWDRDYKFWPSPGNLVTKEKPVSKKNKS